jgi:hypothetical protein
MLEPIIFADDASVVMFCKHFYCFCTMSSSVLSRVNEWYGGNKVVLNLDKTNRVKFMINNLPHCALSIMKYYKQKCIEERVSVKFLVLQIGNHQNWKHHWSCNS